MTEFATELGTRIKGAVLRGESMRRHTTWRIGGPAEVLVIPAEAADVINTLAISRQWGKKITVVGNGSNLLVGDDGLAGAVLKLSGGLNRYSFSGERLEAESGCLLPVLSRQSVEQELSGLEFAVGIPASLGGALVMNAGAHGGEIGNLIEEVQACTLDGQMVRLSNSDCQFVYRHSVFQQESLVILKAILTLTPGNREQGRRLLRNNLERRALTQPVDLPTAGSVFRNPPEVPAAKLIESAGAKGLQIGGAVISTKHANFIVNTGAATAGDVLALIDRVKEMVMEKFQIELHPEIRTLGCSRD